MAYPKPGIRPAETDKGDWRTEATTRRRHLFSRRSCEASQRQATAVHLVQPGQGTSQKIRLSGHPATVMKWRTVRVRSKLSGQDHVGIPTAGTATPYERPREPDEDTARRFWRGVRPGFGQAAARNPLPETYLSVHSDSGVERWLDHGPVYAPATVAVGQPAPLAAEMRPRAARHNAEPLRHSKLSIPPTILIYALIRETLAETHRGRVQTALRTYHPNDMSVLASGAFLTKYDQERMQDNQFQLGTR